MARWTVPPTAGRDGVPVVFISYRRSDASAYARLLYQELTRAEGIDVFMDVDSIAPGADFVLEMRKALERCDVALAVIGQEWLTAADRQGRQRLALATDHVRVELKVALESGAVVLPVLVGDAAMPEPDELPDELAALSSRNAILVHDDAGFRGDIDRLVRFVHSVPGRAGAGAAPTPVAGAPAGPAPTPVTDVSPPGPPDARAGTPWYRRRMVLAAAAVGVVLVALGAAKLVAGGDGSGSGTKPEGGGTIAHQPTSAGTTAATPPTDTAGPPPPAFTRTVASSTLRPPPAAMYEGESGSCVYKKTPTGYLITATGGFQCVASDPAGNTDGLTNAAITVTTAVLSTKPANLPATDYDAYVDCYYSATSDYLFTISPVGLYRLYRRPDRSTPAKSVQLATGTVPGINLVTTPATLRLECYTEQGEVRLRALVNGIEVATGRDPSPLPPGHAYFGTQSNPKKTATLAFSDYTVEATP